MLSLHLSAMRQMMLLRPRMMKTSRTNFHSRLTQPATFFPRLRRFVPLSLQVHRSIIMLLPSSEKSSVLYDQVPNTNTVGFIKLLCLNTLNRRTALLNDHLL